MEVGADETLRTFWKQVPLGLNATISELTPKTRLKISLNSHSQLNYRAHAMLCRATTLAGGKTIKISRKYIPSSTRLAHAALKYSVLPRHYTKCCTQILRPSTTLHKTQHIQIAAQPHSGIVSTLLLSVASHLLIHKGWLRKTSLGLAFLYCHVLDFCQNIEKWQLARAKYCNPVILR